MSIVTLLLMLVVVAVVIKGILMAFAGDWKGLINFYTSQKLELPVTV